MNTVRLSNGEEFLYSNATFDSDRLQLTFTFSEGHSLEDVLTAFSNTEENLDSKGTLELLDASGNKLGTWEGFNILISTNVERQYAVVGEKSETVTVTAVLQKETLTDEFKRQKNLEIRELQDQNQLLTENLNVQQQLLDVVMFDILPMMGGDE